jgi:hypothetical protein
MVLLAQKISCERSIAKDMNIQVLFLFRLLRDIDGHLLMESEYHMAYINSSHTN